MYANDCTGHIKAVVFNGQDNGDDEHVMLLLLMMMMVRMVIAMSVKVNMMAMLAIMW